jgi:nucleoside-diphosphate-sugar epimerase
MYEEFRHSWKHPEARYFHLWNYVDIRDAATVCRQAIEAKVEGAQEYFITAADTFMNVPSRDLVKQYFPETLVNNELAEYGTLLSIDKARHELGYDPKYSWRTVMKDI